MSVPPRCPRTAVTANNDRQQQFANIKLESPLNARATHGDTLIMRSSLGDDEDQGAEAPTALRGTLLNSAEAYH